MALVLAPLVAAETHDVKLVQTDDPAAPFAFEPASLTIAAGDTVRWINTGGTPHTTTSDDGLWDERLDGQDAAFSHTFAEVGTYRYHCKPHADYMIGTITVSTDAGQEPVVDEDTPGPGLAAILIAVVWAARARF